jgi:hypothetical protein
MSSLTKRVLVCVGAYSHSHIVLGDTLEHTHKLERKPI